MADTNAQLEELTRLLEQVNYEMNMFGKVTKQTADDMFDAKVKDKTGINNATKAIDKFGDAAGYVAGAAMSAGKAMLEGKKGAAAFNESIDSMAQAATAAAVALALMNPFGKVVGLLIAGVTAAVGAFAAYTKAANTMADQLYKTYSSLSKSGAAASDGMTGVKKASDQLGLSMDEMGEFAGQIAANSKDLALFSGSVYEGRQRIGDMGDALRGSRQDFLKMGMSMTDVSDGMMGYLKIQTRLGNSQTMTTAQLADGAKKYLVEQDALSKLTGQTRKEMEDQRERALQGEQFAAKIRELQLQGPEGKKAAEELMKMNAIYEAAGPKMASAFQASVTGNLSNADAQEANLASNGAMIETTQKVIAGQMSYTDAVTITGTAMGKTADTVGVVLGQFGAYNQSFGPINEQLKLAQLAQGDITANMVKIKEDQQKLLKGGAADPLLEKQAVLIDTQIQANEAMKAFIFQGIGPAQDKMILLAKATGAAAKGLANITSGEKLSAQEEAQQDKNYGKMTVLEKAETNAAKAIEGLVGIFSEGGKTFLARKRMELEKEGLTKDGRYEQAQDTAPPGRAAGGPVDAGKLYKVGEQGEEFFKPKVAGEIIPNNKISNLVASLTATSKSMTSGSQELGDAFDEIVKDSVKLERLTDTDTKRAEKYSLAFKSYVELKTQLMDLETPDIKAQLDILQQKAAQAGTPGGGGGGGSFGGGGGNMPAMGGGQGVAGGVASQTDLSKMGLKLKTGDVQAEGSKIDPKIIELAQQVQASLPNFAYFSGFNDKFHQEKSPSSSHTSGRAMDFALSKEPTKEEGNEITKWLKSMGASVAIDEYNNPSAKATAGHIHAQIPGYADGGIASTPQIAMVAEKGPEAMIPLENGAIPIKIKLSDALSTPTLAGMNEYAGYNQGPMSTDLSAVKSIAEAVGAFDKVSQTITDPKMWKDILSSGLATNYQLGAATLGTQGIPGLGNDIAERLKEIKEQTNTDSESALKLVADEFKSAMASMSQQLAQMAGNQNEGGMSGLASLMQELVTATKNGVDVQEKILASSY